MKKKMFLSISVLCGLLSAVSGAAKHVADCPFRSEPFTVCRLDQRGNRPRQKMAYAGSFGYTLSDDVSCYVVDESEFALLEERNVTDYLDKGGAIIINDQATTLADINAKVNLDGGQVSFLNTGNTYGTFLLRTERGIELSSYAVGFLADEENQSSPSMAQADESRTPATETITSDDVIDWIIKIIQRLIQEMKERSGDDKSAPEETTQSTILGHASLYNLLYGEWTGKRMCSYKINAEVRQGQKYLDDSGKKRGIYDVLTTYYANVERQYRILEYQPMISTSEELMDASYLQSDVNQQYSLCGSINFSGKEIGAKIDMSNSRSAPTTGQDISNSFDFTDNQCLWDAKPIKRSNFGESYVLKPGIRLISQDDTGTMSADLTMGQFRIRRKFPLCFTSHMMDKYRKTLHLTWKADESLNQTEKQGD